ncbi:hypothetical protein TARUN_7126 [Trichoderma arundinaceum]|uniref:O-methylsterigmatocystin oxidoreductase n=1 Tax=Trichoderma arundinaceum TaxID=490622 RepID=A0A395NGP3_TRIAR|nr:hypothetical protein TARUN_7126 [Trichoderma arundinaceum]
MSSLVIVQGLVVLIGILLYHLFFRKKSELLPLPPGPKPLPLLGNVRDVPPPHIPEFQHWLLFKDKYGPISSVTLQGKAMVIIHDKDVAAELLDKTSLKISSRPQFHFANMCGYDNMMTLMDYTDLFRRHRKFIHQQLGTKALVSRFNNVQDLESKRYLMRVMKNPGNLFQHIRTEAGAIILKIIYDYTIEPSGFDPLVRLIEDVMTNFSHVMIPFTWMVDIFPALKYLPDWFPGTGFKKTAREWKAITEASAYIPYDFVKKQMNKGTYQPSYVSELVEAYGTGNAMEIDDESKEVIAWTAEMIFAGASDTTVSTLMAFVMAMILYPNVQQRAQEEIDRVVGPDRLPGFEDRINLPYVNALIKEMLRWYPIVPVTTAHKSDSEVFLRGYRIPKGSYALVNVWWLTHDPKTYPDPMVLDPDRFLEPRNEPDPAGIFGYGRRACPGRLFAQENLFITISRTLAAFKISNAVDGSGKPIDVHVRHTPGLIDHPEEFPYSIVPRNEKYAEMIQELERVHPWEESSAGSLEWGAFDRYKKEWNSEAK